MSVTHTTTVISTNDAGQAIGLGSFAVGGNREIAFSQAIAVTQTNLLIPVAFAVAALKSIVLVSDQNCTIKTNSSSAPQETLTLVANVPFIWQAGSGVPIPFAGDVNSFYETNTPALNFKGRILTT